MGENGKDEVTRRWVLSVYLNEPYEYAQVHKLLEANIAVRSRPIPEYIPLRRRSKYERREHFRKNELYNIKHKGGKKNGQTDPNGDCPH